MEVPRKVCWRLREAAKHPVLYDPYSIILAGTGQFLDQDVLVSLKPITAEAVLGRGRRAPCLAVSCEEVHL